MISSRTAKGKFLHKIPMVTVNSLQLLQAILRYPVSMKVYIWRPSTPKIHEVDIILLHLLKVTEKGSFFLHGVSYNGRTAPCLKYNTVGPLSR